MVETSEQVIGDETFETFTILNDGFAPSGHVELECRLSGIGEGEPLNDSLFMLVSDETDDKHGTYAPLQLNKQELKQYIDYLNSCYNKMP